MEHEHTSEITCPYCGWEDEDSWALEESGEVTCGECEKKFNVDREVEITYSTSKITCEDKNHKYKIEGYHVSNKKHIGSLTWESRPENEWKYFKVEVCDICDDKKYVDINKEEYEQSIKI